MLPQWLRSRASARGRNQPHRRPRSFVPRVEDLEGRDVPATLIASGLEGAQGSAIGPGGALFVTESIAGRLSRINLRTGDVTTVATGLPTGPFAGFGGGAVDVAFQGSTAYVLVVDVASDVGGTDVVGLYRVDGPASFTVIADIGAWSAAHPPQTDFFLPTGNAYAVEPFRGGFLVTDGHHNRVLDVRLDGTITEVIAFEDVVPTGLAVRGNTVYVAQAGPVPHLPENGRVVSFRWNKPGTTQVAAGAPLLTDVEFGLGNALYALSNGVWEGVVDGDPAAPNTGSLLRVNGNGTFTVLEEEIDRPTSLEFVGGTAYVVNLAGEVWRFDDVSEPPFGRAGAGSNARSHGITVGSGLSSAGGDIGAWGLTVERSAPPPAAERVGATASRPEQENGVNRTLSSDAYFVELAREGSSWWQSGLQGRLSKLRRV